MTTLAIYSYLLAAAIAYAMLLAWLQKKVPAVVPDLTWLEVIVGTVLCLLAPYLDLRFNGPLTSELYEQRVWVAFAVGGIPIVVWQLGKSIRARLQAEREIREFRGNTPDRP